MIDPVPTNDEYLRRHFAKKLREFSEVNGDPSLHAAITRYGRGHRDLVAQCSAPTLCHNDFHEGNILVTGSGVTGFVDVENAIATDPLMDIAKIDCYSIRGDPVKLAGLLDGYGELPDHWQQRLEVDIGVVRGIGNPLPAERANPRRFPPATLCSVALSMQLPAGHLQERVIVARIPDKQNPPITTERPAPPAGRPSTPFPATPAGGPTPR